MSQIYKVKLLDKNNIQKIFVFKGKYRAVLIQYPSNAQMDSIFKL